MAIRIGYGEWLKGVQIIFRKQLNKSAKKKSRYAYEICSDCHTRHSEHFQCAAKKAKKEEKDGA